MFVENGLGRNFQRAIGSEGVWSTQEWVRVVQDGIYVDRYSGLFGGSTRPGASGYTTSTEACGREWSRLKAQSAWDEMHGTSSGSSEPVAVDATDTSAQVQGGTNVDDDEATPCDVDPWEYTHPENYHMLIEEVQREEATSG